jgi:hypothetical protein
MDRSVLLFLAALFCAAPAAAADSRYASIYLDGAVIEQTAQARKGYLEILLPATLAVDSLRIKPVGSTEILRVVTAPLKSDRNSAKELDAITAKEELLNDRLKALAVKEEIFKSAAKSQSGKAPRRTKTNPEPLATIRQGTDYAVSQLEAVYQAKRRTLKELATLSDRKNALRQNGSVAAAVAKVWVTPANAAVTASWIQTDIYWIPEYQLRIDPAGAAQLAVFTQVNSPGNYPSKAIHLSSSQTASAPIALPVGNNPAIKVPLTVTSVSGGDQSRALSVSVVNASQLTLPQGGIACFRNGSYEGKGVLAETGPGKSVDISCSGSKLK